jgi:hypothetical protein
VNVVVTKRDAAGDAARNSGVRGGSGSSGMRHGVTLAQQRRVAAA